MSVRILLIACGVALMYSCNGKKAQSNPDDMEGKAITVVGIAQNGKDGALVLTDDRETYYLDGLDSWDEDVHGKQVKVTGTLKIETLSEDDLVNEKGEYSAGMTGEKKMIHDARWEVKK